MIHHKINSSPKEKKLLRALTLLVDKRDWGSPRHAIPVGMSLCLLKTANGT